MSSLCPKSCQKISKNAGQGATWDALLEFWRKMAPQGPPKWSKMQYYHHNIAIFTSCPKSPKWCHMVPKGFQNESLGTPKCSKVEPSGLQRDPRGAQSAAKCAKRLSLETPWNASWAQSGPSALQGSIFEWILSDLRCILVEFW